MKRDPRIEPKEGDVLSQANGTLKLHIDMVAGGEVYYRVVDRRGGLLGAYRKYLTDWRESAPYACEGEE